MSFLLQHLFGVHKPVIGMAHLPALPGTPRHDSTLTLARTIDMVASDVDKLTLAGVDAILFCNADDRPYQTKAGVECVAFMTRIISEIRLHDRPFGVDFLWDATASLAIAAATGATFIRGVVTGVYESDMGLHTPDAAALLRFRRDLGAEQVRVFANVTPEFASPLGSRSVAQRARSAAFSSLVDGILISGMTPGIEPDLGELQEAKDAVGANVPVLCNSGANVKNIRRMLEIADGAIVGSSLKLDGYIWNPVDPARAEAFMRQVGRVREAGQ